MSNTDGKIERFTQICAKQHSLAVQLLDYMFTAALGSFNFYVGTWMVGGTKWVLRRQIEEMISNLPLWDILGFCLEAKPLRWRAAFLFPFLLLLLCWPKYILSGGTIKFGMCTHAWPQKCKKTKAFFFFFFFFFWGRTVNHD